MKPDKQQINELERRLAQSWRTVKNLKQNLDSMTDEEIEKNLATYKLMWFMKKEQSRR